MIIYIKFKDNIYKACFWLYWPTTKWGQAGVWTNDKVLGTAGTGGQYEM